MPQDWSWEASNGDASDAQTQMAYQAATEKGSTHDFSHWVWNDLVQNTNSLLLENGQVWAGNYASFEDTLLDAEGVLSALKFNSLRLNILNTGWPWAYNKNRPDYIGREAVRRKDFVYGSYLIELAHKYSLMWGFLNDTAGSALTLEWKNEIPTNASFLMMAMTGLMVSFATSSIVPDEAEISLIPFLPTPLGMTPIANIQALTNTSLTFAVFAQPALPSEAAVEVERYISMLPIRNPAGQVLETYPVNVQSFCDLETESSDDLIFVGSSAIGIQSAPPKMLCFYCKVMNGTSLKSGICSTEAYCAGWVRGILLSMPAVKGTLGSRAVFQINGQPHTSLIQSAGMKSELTTESRFSGWWAVTKKLSTERLHSMVTSSSEFVLRLCSEIPAEGYSLNSGITSNVSAAAAKVQSSILSDVVGESSTGSKSEFIMDFHVPRLVGSLDSLSGISSKMVADTGMAGTVIARLNPYTVSMAIAGKPVMTSEARLETVDNPESVLTSIYAFSLSSELTLAFETESGMQSIYGFDSMPVSTVPQAVPGQSVLYDQSQIHLMIAPAWIYPTQRGDDLYIPQVRTAEQTNTHLSIG